ncbi:hypothetical protein EPIR_0310 [Erwinia piriflorinigrans CFBP 5888]|uniref:Uncharacterized protein n=1 Tax=Erwinia piriflorinigrans CFBP 5888 TaxID=1161919 RepID=V5Z318_9GAMM|nr:hypothetical protein EPIR_0310 [Erwinia piriflorinigrans CFBP 5888]
MADGENARIQQKKNPATLRSPDTYSITVLIQVT